MSSLVQKGSPQFGHVRRLTSKGRVNSIYQSIAVMPFFFFGAVFRRFGLRPALEPTNYAGRSPRKARADQMIACSHRHGLGRVAPHASKAPGDPGSIKFHG